MLANPLIQRYRYSLLRPQQLWIYLTIYLCVAMLMLFINYTSYKYQTGFEDLTEFSKAVYYQFLVLQTVILWVFVTFNAGTAITTEITQKSYDFFRMLPLPPRSKTIGILIGKNLVVLLLAAINCGFLVVFGLLGQVDSTLQLQIAAALAATTLLLGCVALLMSLITPPKKKTSNAGFLVLLVFIFGYGIPMVMMLFDRSESPDEIRIRFFDTKVPILILTALLSLYFSLWAFKGILRKFTREREPLFSKAGAIIFMIGLATIILGLFKPHFSADIPACTYGYWLLCLVPTLFVLCGSLRSFERYMERTRFILSRTTDDRRPKLPLLTFSNLSLGLVLFVIWLAFAIVAVMLSKIALGPSLYVALLLFSFYIFPVLLLEVFALHKTANSRIGVLLIFIFALQLILPPIFAGVTGNSSLSLLSPIGFFQELIISSTTDDIGPYTGVLLVNIALAVVPAMLIWRRYGRILGARTRM